MDKNRSPLFEKTSSALEESRDISLEIYRRYLKEHKWVFLLLEGYLGSGKTFFVRSMGEGLGIRDNINSPSFNLLNIYRGAGIVFFHYDLYRLQEPLELEQLDFQENWSLPPKEGDDTQFLHLIEWPGFALPLLPEEGAAIYRLSIEFLSDKKDGPQKEGGKRLFRLYREGREAL